VTALAPATLTVLLALLGVLNSFGSDMVIPALPSLRDDLAVTDWQAQQVISLFFAASAVMSLFYGALSDAWGRRTVMLGALLIMALTAVGILLTAQIEQLWILRTLQGLASAAGLVISRTIVRDLHSGRVAQRLLSRIMMLQPLSLLLTPLIGGWLAHHWGWRAVFALLALITLALLLVSWRWLPETLPAARRRAIQPRAMGRAYGAVLRNGAFVRLSLAHVANWVGMAMYAFAAPVVVMRHLGRDVAESWLVFAPITIGLVAGFWLFPRLVRQCGELCMLGLAYGVLAGAVIANLLLCWLLPPGLLHLLPLLAYAFGMALALPVLIDRALAPVDAEAGIAASCQTFLQFAVMALAAGILVPLLWHSMSALAGGLAVVTALGAVALGLEVRARFSAPDPVC